MFVYTFLDDANGRIKYAKLPNLAKASLPLRSDNNNCGLNEQPSVCPVKEGEFSVFKMVSVY